MKIMNLQQQNGASLIVVMLILLVVSILGVGGAQIAMMSERGARNERDYQLAAEGTAAALLDAEFDMRKSSRKDVFLEEQNFVDGCGSSGDSKGLCSPSFDLKPTWLTVDLSTTANTTEFGEKTSRLFAADTKGIQPYKKPHYIIEALPDLGIYGNKSVGTKKLIYRVTAMGFGPREEVQSVAQIVFRKD
jgi:type IV pilus assembly protein PilX